MSYSLSDEKKEMHVYSLRSCINCGYQPTNPMAKYCSKCGTSLENRRLFTPNHVTEESDIIQILVAILNEVSTITNEIKHLQAILRAANDTTDLHKQITPITNEAVGEIIVDSTQASTKDTNKLITYWLGMRRITLKDYRQPEAADNVFDRLSLFLGERYESLSRLHDFIRKNLTTGNNFYLNLSTRTQEDIGYSTQFCSMLSDYAFLAAYKYNKETKTIYATPQRVGKVINFFNGGWFERFIFIKISSLLLSLGLPYEYLSNAKVSLPNGDDFELDMLFMIEDKILWVECKTGDYQAYVAKYSNVRKMLTTPKHCSLLVILDLSDDIAKNLTDIYDITVTHQGNFLEKIQNFLGVPSGEETQQPIQQADLSFKSIHQPSLSYTGSLSTLLNKCKLRPCPEHRMSVIKHLIDIFDSLDQPKNMSEIKSTLAERVVISKSLLQDILNAIVRGGCVLDEMGAVVRSFTLPVITLISRDPNAIQEKCTESYIAAILAVVPRYFEDEQHIYEFEQVVGAKAPEPAVIQSLQHRIKSL